MSVIEKEVSYFVLLLAILVFPQVNGEHSRCNLISKGECVQHCERTNDNEDCHLTCTNTSLCSQVCDPKYGNSGGKKCRFNCNASDECVQHCTPGNCLQMTCSNARANCEQYCTEGSCQDMVCNSQKCYQNCRNGGCTMKCGANVEYCEQICPGGNCRMVCEAKSCRAYCPHGTCDTHGPSAEIMTQCNVQSRKHHCVQECPASGCYCKAAGRIRSCKQACGAGDAMDSCNLITCHSHACRQECGSNCSLTCSADHCVQLCHGSGCNFQCSGNVRSCKQICIKGNCVFNCAAEKCKNECPGNNCVFNQVGDAQGVFLDAKCDYRHNGQCEPLCKECVHGGYDLKCSGGSGEECNQVCLGGKCGNVKCAAKNSCKQYCAGGRCDAMECKSKQCHQTCSGGKCAAIKCDSHDCTQTCLDNCNKMICDSHVCRQECFLGNCNMECSGNVSKCYQNCYSGKCNFKCNAKKCVSDCRDKTCTETNVKAGVGQAMQTLANVLILVLVTSTSLYINNM